MNDNREKVDVDQSLFELGQYVAASAEGLQNEPEDYGPLRLLEILSRLGKLMGRAYDDRFMEEIAQKADEKKELLLADRQEFYDSLSEIVIEFAREAKNRY
ncbi:MAG: DUF6092 family protein [Candidatus Bipolaricaulota bacterium]